MYNAEPYEEFRTQNAGPVCLVPKKVDHAVNYGESERHTDEWMMWTHCWKDFRAESSWVVSPADFKLQLGEEDRPALCD